VPLYACDRCGFTSAAFRVDAANAHRDEYPQCTGSIQIIFRSDDRYRAPHRSPALLAPSELAARSGPDAGIVASPPDRSLEIRERLESDGRLRLTLLGDLDLGSAETLGQRLRELHKLAHPVRLDLSQLAFIDSIGLRSLVLALGDARADGWELEVDRDLGPSVARIAQITGIARVLWPSRDLPASGETADARPGGRR
jgi:anti-anti-sigma factor